jgi:hypothetical protein
MKLCGFYAPLIIIFCCLLIGCGNRNTRYGFGFGVYMEAPPGMKKGAALSSWYTSSSTSSSTMTKEKFLGAALDAFIQHEHQAIAEALAAGRGSHLDALATLARVPQHEQFFWLSNIRQNCFHFTVEYSKKCFRQQAKE